MAAPTSNITWGNTVTGSKSTRKGKIGIYTGVTETTTQYKVTVQVWFWSMYSIDDSNNTYTYNGTVVGSKTINHTVATGEGWSTSNQTKLGESTYTYDKGTSTSTKTYTAKFTGIDSVGSSNVMSASRSITVPALSSYTVTYNANGGTGAPSKQTKWYGKNLTLSTTKPTRTGYSFLGWATSSTATSANSSYDPGDTYSGNANLTLYAVWKANTYTVKYDANGGSGAPGNQTKTYGSTLTLSSTKPTRTNYNFKGWGTSANATSASYQPGGSYTANAAITLYAIWELAYKKPVISNLKASRCNSEGLELDDGTYAVISFKWSTEKSVSSIKVTWTNSTSNTVDSITISASGTSGTVNQVFGSGGLDPDSTYNIEVVVTDSGGSSDLSTTLPGTMFPIDVLAEGKGIAFGKPAEHADYMDVNYNSRFRKLSYFEGKIQTKMGGYVHRNGGTSGTAGYFRVCTFTVTRTYANAPIMLEVIQRNQVTTYYICFASVNSTDPDIGWFAYKGSHANPAYIVKTTQSTWELYVKKEENYGDLTVTHFDKSIYMNEVSVAWHTDQVTTLPTGYVTATLYQEYQSIKVPNASVAIYGTDTDGVSRQVFEPISANNNCVIGYDLYAQKKGNTHIYGHDVLFYVSNIATPSSYRPYRRQGDTSTLTIETAGYVTNGSAEVHFFIPFAAPIVGAPTITLSSGNGFILRQDSKYTHGSAFTNSTFTYALPTKYEVTRFMFHGIYVKATFSSTANAINNAPIGVQWNGTITLS